LRQPRLRACARRSGRIGCRSDHEVGVLGHVVGDPVEAVDPQCAHRAWGRLPLPVHEVVDDQRPPRRAEQLAEAHHAYSDVPVVKSASDLLEHVIVDLRAGRKSAAKLGHPLALPHQFDLSEPQLLPSSKVLGRLIRQSRMPHHRQWIVLMDSE
jgi:hypothetical protein